MMMRKKIAQLLVVIFIFSVFAMPFSANAKTVIPVSTWEELVAAVEQPSITPKQIILTQDIVSQTIADERIMLQNGNELYTVVRAASDSEIELNGHTLNLQFVTASYGQETPFYIPHGSSLALSNGHLKFSGNMQNVHIGIVNEGRLTLNQISAEFTGVAIGIHLESAATTTISDLLMRADGLIGLNLSGQGAVENIHVTMTDGMAVLYEQTTALPISYATLYSNNSALAVGSNMTIMDVVANGFATKVDGVLQPDMNGTSLGKLVEIVPYSPPQEQNFVQLSFDPATQVTCNHPNPAQVPVGATVNVKIEPLAHQELQQFFVNGVDATDQVKDGVYVLTVGNTDTHLSAVFVEKSAPTAARTSVFTIDKPSVRITEKGTTRTETLDIAPYIKNNRNHVACTFCGRKPRYACQF